MQIGLSDTKTIIEKDSMPYRKKLKILVVICIAVILVSLCLETIQRGVISPLKVVENYRLWMEYSFKKATGGNLYLLKQEIEANGTVYYDVISRLKITAITFICGIMLAMSGSIFQSVFRNPMAAPTMLGVSTGVNLGILILVLQFGGFAVNMPLEKYVYCYIGAAVMLAIVIGLGKLSSGKNKMSVYDLLIVGAIVSQLVGAVQTYITYNMENDELLLYQEISRAISVNTDNISFAFLGIAVLVCIIPMYMIRFSFNAVCFDNDDSRSMGVNSGAMKLATLILGTFMITAAMVHCGTVGMITLIAPFISRGVFGAEYRKVFWGNLLIGGILLVVCRDVASMITFNAEGLPLGTVVNFVTVPIFVIIMIKQRRVFE
ncbi:MAG: iron ABC transporter permease [Eubacteriaceae bacterium]|nr:iron ABC transporter permease [Eubacteriaceae bacterium]